MEIVRLQRKVLALDERVLLVEAEALVMMDVHLIDNADLDLLAEKCVRDGRYDLMISLLPLVLERGTASPANPMALF
jgi:hypothetical protein